MPGRGNLEVYADQKKNTVRIPKRNCVLTRSGRVSMLARGPLTGTSRRARLEVPRVWLLTLDFGRSQVGSNAFLCMCRVPKISVLGRHRVPDHSEVIPRQCQPLCVFYVYPHPPSSIRHSHVLLDPLFNPSLYTYPVQRSLRYHVSGMVCSVHLAIVDTSCLHVGDRHVRWCRRLGRKELPATFLVTW